MKSYAQSSEDLFIADYFSTFKGTLLEIGANNGLDLSNSRLLIEQNWQAYLIEPASVFHELQGLYKDNEAVKCYNLAIGDKHGLVTLYESGAHVRGGSDRALVSSLDKAETQRWTLAGVKFEERQVEVIPFNTFWELAGFPQFDFISIDAEGLDAMILKQMDLKALGCKCLIIEYNGSEGLKTDFCRICVDQFGMKVALVNRENIIFVK